MANRVSRLKVSNKYLIIINNNNNKLTDNTQLTGNMKGQYENELKKIGSCDLINTATGSFEGGEIVVVVVVVVMAVVDGVV